MSDVNEIIIGRFTVLYGEPKTSDVDGFYSEYVKALRRTPSDILSEAADRVVKGHRYHSWPTVGECMDAVNSVHEERESDRARHAKPAAEKEWPKPTPEQKARVDALMASFKAAMRAMNPNTAGYQFPPTDRNAWEARFGKPAARRQEADAA